jgi:hypothetical protein
MPNPIPDSGLHAIATSEDGDGQHSLVVSIILALIILSAIAATLVHYTYHKDFATGRILSTTVFPIHIDAPRSGAVQMLGAQASDDVYLLPVVEIANHITLPIFIESLAVDAVLSDGTELHCTGAQAGDFPKMWAAYPDLSRAPEFTGDSPLLRDTQIDPDSSAHGLVMVHFPISREEWQHRRSATLTISFYHQSPLSIAFPQTP